MRLTNVRITEFQSVKDSTEFEIGDVTCLVGKNESGKTAVLQALYRLNPIIEADDIFDATDDFPRRGVVDYKKAVKSGRREPAEVIRATYALESDDTEAVAELFGTECLSERDPVVSLHKGYSNEITYSDLNVDEDAALKHLVTSAGLPQPLTEQVLEQETTEAMVSALASAEQTEAVQRLLPVLRQIADGGVSTFLCHHVLQERIPQFLYFDEYYQIRGQDNLDALRQRVREQSLENADYPLLGLLDLAGLDVNELVETERTEALLASLEAAENQLTQTALTYWSQNRHLRMRFDIRPARRGDPTGMTTGMNIWGRIHDTMHMVSTALGTRSRGFVWFFSFLAWYSHLRREGKPLILLLDEPGLSLHAKAQSDLLRYFEKELKPNHQLIYTTHSPFMVDPTHFERVRIVQDLSIEPAADDLPDDKRGTKVITEVLDATPDSLFPLQGALGYEIHQTLFVGPNNLVVEGVSDLLYIQTISALLQEEGRVGLSAGWTITPVGGSDKVSTFVALIGAQSDLNVAVLIDYQEKDQQSIENLYKRKLLSKRKVLTYADYVGSNEADVEDMFDPDFFLKLVNGAFGSSIDPTDLASGHPRILRRIKEYLESNALPNGASFNHYRPARYLGVNIDDLSGDLTDQVLDRFEQAFKALNELL
ncbi:MAG: ATP-binding protein [Gammaproteobacteria bacterium]|nr:ATP-binding protein [Gammaproteobacteria bacterium]